MDCHIKTVPNCSCGAEPRLRSSGGYIWIECKKKCGKKTGVYPEVFDGWVARANAARDWEKLVNKNG